MSGRYIPAGQGACVGPAGSWRWALRRKDMSRPLQSDAPDFRVTRVMRGADSWTDHRLLIARVKLLSKNQLARMDQKCQRNIV